MAVRRLAPAHLQPGDFALSPENLTWAEAVVAKYPPGRQASAVISLLWRAQEQNGGWLPAPAIDWMAEYLQMPRIRVLEVATFYTMFQLWPVGRRAHVQVCGTTPCMLRGAEALRDVCKRRIAPRPGEISADGDFSWEEVECLGACVNAPLVQIGPDTFEDLVPARLDGILDEIAAGQTPKPGPQIDRQFAAPEGGVSTLHEADGHGADEHGPDRAEDSRAR